MYTTTARKLGKRVSEVEKPTTATVVQTANPIPEIEINPFYQAHFNLKESPEAKQKILTDLLVANNLKAFEDFKAWLAHQRREMNLELIRLTNTNVFANLQKIISEMETKLLEYEEAMKPHADLMDSIHNLRSNGMTEQAFREIVQDRKNEEENAKFLEAKSDEVKILSQKITKLYEQNALARMNTNIFGRIKKDAQAEIVRNDLELVELDKQLATLKSEILEKETETKQTQSQLQDYELDKQRLRKFLDLNSDEIKANQAKMRDKAIEFVQVNGERLAANREDQQKQLNLTANLEDASNSMIMVFANLTDAIKDANKEVIRRRDELSVVPENETTSQKILREQKIREIDRQLEKLTTSSKDTLNGLAELNGEGIQVQSMRQANEQQSAVVDTLYTRGIASVASSLNVNIQSLSITALAQATNLAKETMQRLQDTTSEVAKRQVVQNAIRAEDDVIEMQRAITNIAEMGEALSDSADITRKTLTDAKARMDELSQIIQETVERRKSADAVTSDVMRTDGKTSEKKSSPPTDSPFKFAA